MEALFLLIPISLGVLLVAVAIFIRMNTGGQFDESEAAAWSVLMDDDQAARHRPTNDPSTIDSDQSPVRESRLD